MKINFKLLHYLASVGAIIFLLTSCGTPNPFEIENTLNAPSEVTGCFRDDKLQITITGYNSEKNAPGFGGYNIYVGVISSETEIKKRRLLGEGRRQPTVSVNPNSRTVTTVVSIEKLIYTNLDSGMQDLSRDFSIYKSYYFLAAAYNTYDSTEVFHHKSVLVIPPLIISDGKAQLDSQIAHDELTLTITAAAIIPESGIGIQHGGYVTNWQEIQSAPSGGYMNDSVELSIQHCYFVHISSISAYGKLLPKKQEGTTITYDLVYSKGVNSF